MVRVRLRGKYNINEIRRLVDVLSVEVDDLKFSPVLVDDRELDTGDVTAPELIEMRDAFFSKRIVFACRKIAILTTQRADVSLASTFKRLAQPGVSALIDVFRDEGEAISWLRAVE